MNRWTRVLLILGCSAAGCLHTAAQSPRVELDHVFVVVHSGGEAEIAALRSAGFKVGSRIAKHAGQGTASVAVLFENAYLELIWLDSSVSIDPEHAADAKWFEEAAAWRTSGHSPFGLGLRRLSGDASALPVREIEEIDSVFESIRSNRVIAAGITYAKCDTGCLDRA